MKESVIEVNDKNYEIITSLTEVNVLLISKDETNNKITKSKTK